MSHASSVDPHTAAVAANTRRLREDRGWSARVLSEHLANIGVDFPRNSVANLENGRRAEITLGQTAALARIFEVGIESLAEIDAGPCLRCARNDEIFRTIANIAESARTAS